MKFILPDTQENMEMLRSLVQFERLLRRIVGVRNDGRIVFKAFPYDKGVSNKKLRRIVQAKPFRDEMPADGDGFEIKTRA